MINLFKKCISLLKSKVKLKYNFIKNQKTHKELLEISIKAKGALSQLGYSDILYVYNTLQYVALLNYDLSCLCEDVIFTKSEWKKKLYCRHLVITLYECTQDFKKMLSKELRTSLNNIGFVDFNILDTIHSDIATFTKRHEKFLYQIRNTVIGHRDKNASLQIEIIESLDVAKILKLANELIKWATKFQSLSQNIIYSMDIYLKNKT